MTADSLQRLRRLRWSPNGRGPDVVDCVGFVLLYCAENGIPLPEAEPGNTPEGPARAACTPAVLALVDPIGPLAAMAGNAVFFANAKGVLMHVGVVTEDGRLMHCTFGGVRLDRSLDLLARVGLRAVGCVPLGDTARLGQLLAIPSLHEPITIILGVLAIVSLVLSIVLMPNLAAYGSTRGRYGFDGLVTQNTAEVPLPDVLGKVWCAGNIIYQALTDKTGEVTDPAEQKTVSIVVFCAGPVSGYGLLNLRINGNTWDSNVWFSDAPPLGDTTTGFYYDLGGLGLTTRAEVWDGTILSLDDRPSITMRQAVLDIPGSRPEIVPIDLRASYDRAFPLYGLNGCAYGVFRLVDSRKYSQFNVIALVQGRPVRLFDETGFLTSTATAEDLGALWDGSRKYGVLLHPDVVSVASVTVNGTSYDEMDATHQTGNVYRLNREQGYLEFLTAPAAAATVLVTYTYYQQAWRTTPTHHVLHLLTNERYGLGKPASKIDWASFDAAQDYFSETVDTPTPSGTVSDLRYTTNYTVDRRRPALDHLQALLDACTSVLLVSDGKLKLKPIRNSSSVYSFDADSILRDRFKVSFLDQSTAANRLKVVFNDVDNFSAQTAVFADDLADQDARREEGLEPILEKALHFPAVTGWAQAYRLAQQRLALELGRTWTVEFTTNLIGLALEPGDTIDLTHPAMPSWAGELARIDEISHDENDRLVIKASQYVELPYA
jgi:hypothetical protein